MNVFWGYNGISLFVRLSMIVSVHQSVSEKNIGNFVLQTFTVFLLLY